MARIMARGALILLALRVFAIWVSAVGRHGAEKASDSGWTTIDGEDSL